MKMSKIALKITDETPFMEALHGPYKSSRSMKVLVNWTKIDSWRSTSMDLSIIRTKYYGPYNLPWKLKCQRLESPFLLTTLRSVKLCMDRTVVHVLTWNFSKIIGSFYGCLPQTVEKYTARERTCEMPKNWNLHQISVNLLSTDLYTSGVLQLSYLLLYILASLLHFEIVCIFSIYV